MRDNCTELRDLAMVDMLASTGMRVGEMVLLNKEDINFNERECVVFGKGDKERMLRRNRTIDWQKKETARAQMRKMVKRLLKKYDYPPEDYEFAINTVISQCELWTDNVEPRKEEKIYKFVSERELSMVAEERAPYGTRE